MICVKIDFMAAALVTLMISPLLLWLFLLLLIWYFSAAPSLAIEINPIG
jgi:hypothetical protein